MNFQHLTVGSGETIHVDGDWRIAKVTVLENGEAHIVLQAEDVEEWRGVHSA